MIVTFSLGIGLASTAFNITNGFIHKELPFEEADRILVLRRTAPTRNIDDMGVTAPDLERAKAEDKAIKLLASAVRQEDGTYSLTVAPTPLPATHPLAQLSGQQVGIVYHTDIYGTISAAILEEEPIPSAATMLRDLLSIYRS